MLVKETLSPKIFESHLKRFPWSVFMIFFISSECVCKPSGIQISRNFKCHRHLNFFSFRVFFFLRAVSKAQLIKMLFLTNKSLLIISFEKGEENNNFIYETFNGVRKTIRCDDWSKRTRKEWESLSLSYANEKRSSRSINSSDGSRNKFGGFVNRILSHGDAGAVSKRNLITRTADSVDLSTWAINFLMI